jgi:hypothetical protein
MNADSSSSSSSCGVKYNRATKKRRRIEETYEDAAPSAAVSLRSSHCATCTCCRPIKRPKVGNDDETEPTRALRNVCWVLDDERKVSLGREPAKSTDILNDCRQSSLLEDTAQQDELANEPNRLLPPPVSPQSSIRLEKANRRKHRPTQGDWVLIREMAPTQPEIAQQVSQQALNSDSCDSGQEVENEMEDQHVIQSYPAPQRDGPPSTNLYHAMSDHLSNGNVSHSAYPGPHTVLRSQAKDALP